MIRRPPRSTLSSSSAASDVYKRQVLSSLVARCCWKGSYGLGRVAHAQELSRARDGGNPARSTRRWYLRLANAAKHVIHNCGKFSMQMISHSVSRRGSGSECRSYGRQQDGQSGAGEGVHAPARSALFPTAGSSRRLALSQNRSFASLCACPHTAGHELKITTRVPSHNRTR